MPTDDMPRMSCVQNGVIKYKSDKQRVEVSQDAMASALLARWLAGQVVVVFHISARTHNIQGPGMAVPMLVVEGRPSTRFTSMGLAPATPTHAK